MVQYYNYLSLCTRTYKNIINQRMLNASTQLDETYIVLYVICRQPSDWTASQFDQAYRPQKEKLTGALRRAVHRETKCALERQLSLEQKRTNLSRARLVCFFFFGIDRIMMGEKYLFSQFFWPY